MIPPGARSRRAASHWALEKLCHQLPQQYLHCMYSISKATATAAPRSGHLWRQALTWHMAWIHWHGSFPEIPKGVEKRKAQQYFIQQSNLINKPTLQLLEHSKGLIKMQKWKQHTCETCTCRHQGVILVHEIHLTKAKERLGEDLPVEEKHKDKRKGWYIAYLSFHFFQQEW